MTIAWIGIAVYILYRNRISLLSHSSIEYFIAKSEIIGCSSLFVKAF